VANKAFYEEVIALAKKYNFLVVNDAAYLEFTYNEKPLSILSIEGAKDVAVELYTLSKSHNMTGYRIGFIAGNKDVIAKFLKYVDYYDSGQFAPIEYAASVALQNDDGTDIESPKLYEAIEVVRKQINCLQADKEYYKKNRDEYQDNVMFLSKQCDELQEENERLNNLKRFEKFIFERIHIDKERNLTWDFATKEAEQEAFEQELEKLFDISTAKSEAYKEFAERLKPLMFGKYCDYFNFEITNAIIDNLLKEMVGEDNV
jgi:aspartate/methionine/tyrosine aminotransferase